MKKLILAVMLVSLAACGTTGKKADAAQGIAASNAAFEAAFSSGDAAGIAALYQLDAVVLPPDTDRIEGREAIQALWQSYIDAGLGDFDLMSDGLEVHDGAGVELGRFSVMAPDGKGGRVAVTGKYIVLWKRGDDGVWRLKWDIWNDNPAG